MNRADVLRIAASDLNTLVATGTLGRWALCGGLALAVWGAPRATLDIDVLADPAKELAAMKLRAGGPQDLVDADRLEALPGFDRERYAAWKKRLRVRW